MKNKSFAQFLKGVYGSEDKIPDRVPDEVLDKFVDRANEKANIKNLGHSVEDGRYGNQN